MVNTMKIGKYKEFEPDVIIEDVSGFNVSEFINKEFVYTIRKKALELKSLSQILWITLDYLEQHGLSQKNSSTPISLIKMKMMGLFSAIFGQEYLDFVCIRGWHIFNDESSNISDIKMDMLLQPLVNEKKHIWEKLVKEYENEIHE
jgi:hypothetical protein